MNLHVTPIKKIEGEIKVPGDKSISHRAVMLGALADGITTVTNFLTGADCLSTIDCFRAMGVGFALPEPNVIVVKGRGLFGLKEPDDVLNVGNSGTTIRLMMGVLAGQNFFSAVTGDESIRKRPMGRVTKPLQEMGAVIKGRQHGTLAPLSIQGGRLNPIYFDSPVASAQVKSSVLLAGLYARGVTTVWEPHKSRDHTERMLAYLGAEVEAADKAVKLKGHAELTGKPVEVPGDISSAAFFMAAAAALPGSNLRINRVGINPTRTGIIDALSDMGADIQLLNEKLINGEPVADIVIQGQGLRGIVLEGDIIPRLIDEIPIIAVAAAVADGETVIRDAAELKVKESNRIAAIATELGKMGVEVKEIEDGMLIKGGTALTGAVCSSHNDHRIAMSMAVAGLMAKGETVVQNTECVNISFPNFEAIFKNLAH